MTTSEEENEEQEIYDRAKLLAILKQDEAARKYLRHVIANTSTPPRDIPTSAIRKLELSGVLKLLDHRHALVDNISGAEMALLLDLATDDRVLSIPERRAPSSGVKPEWSATWAAVQAQNCAVPYFSAQINPRVVGLENVKAAILLSLISAEDVHGDRGRVHTLLVGKAGSAKTALGAWCVSKLGIIGASHRTSLAGLTCQASGSEVIPGALMAANNSSIVLDELDKFERRSIEGLLEVMEQGTITVNVGRVRQKFDASCRIIASANKLDKFSEAILDRFDFKIELSEPTKEQEQDIAAGIAEWWRRSKPSYNGIELKAYLQSIQEFKPEISESVHQGLRELLFHYVGTDATARGSARRKESVLRVSYAIAKANRRPMAVEDALTAIIYLNSAMTTAQLEYLRSKALGRTVS